MSRGHVVAQAHVTAGRRRPRTARAPRSAFSRTCSRSSCASLLRAVASARSSSDCEEAFCCEQVPGPGERLARQVAIRFGPRHLGLELGVVHLEERRARAPRRRLPAPGCRRGGPRCRAGARSTASPRSGRWRGWRRPRYRSGPRPPRPAWPADRRPRLRQRRRRAGRPTPPCCTRPAPARGPARSRIGAATVPPSQKFMYRSHGTSLFVKSRWPRIASRPASASRAA